MMTLVEGSRGMHTNKKDSSVNLAMLIWIIGLSPPIFGVKKATHGFIPALSEIPLNCKDMDKDRTHSKMRKHGARDNSKAENES